jgi:hypothetical protein
MPPTLRRNRTSPPRHRLAALACASFVGITVAGAKPARADDAACVAASENEIPLRKAGHLRDALKQLVICAASTCPSEVASECGRRIVVLNAALPTLVLSATDGAGNDVVTVSVTLDGAPFLAALDGQAQPIDPGSHSLTFTEPGKPPVEKTVLVREGEKDRHINVVLGPPGAGAPATGSSWSTQKTIALAAGGVGIVGIGLGTAFGIIATSDASTTKSDCVAATCTSSQHATALTEHSSATTAGNVSTATFIVGAVGVAAGVVLWFTAPKGEKPAAAAPTVGGLTFDPVITAHGGAMMLGGSFQ